MISQSIFLLLGNLHVIQLPRIFIKVTKGKALKNMKKAEQVGLIYWITVSEPSYAGADFALL